MTYLHGNDVLNFPAKPPSTTANCWDFTDKSLFNRRRAADRDVLPMNGKAIMLSALLWLGFFAAGSTCARLDLTTAKISLRDAHAE